jgi:hypothetical protein
MEYIRLGNFEIWPDQLNWSVPGKLEDYIGMPQKYHLMLDESLFNEFIALKIGGGWRLPDLNEMSYIGDISRDLGISKSKKLYFPTTYNYIIQETLNPDQNSESRTFFDLENITTNSQPWIPGFFLLFSGKGRTFKIQPVRDINF